MKSTMVSSLSTDSSSDAMNELYTSIINHHYHHQCAMEALEKSKSILKQHPKLLKTNVGLFQDIIPHSTGKKRRKEMSTLIQKQYLNYLENMEEMLLSSNSTVTTCTTSTTSTNNHSDSQHSRNTYKSSPIHWTATIGNEPLLTLFLQHSTKTPTKIDSNGSLALHHSSQQGHTSITTTLLQAHPQGSSQTNHYGSLPLHYACQRMNNIPIVQLLLKAYPSGVGIQNEEGNVPLHIAAECGDLDLCALLVESKYLNQISHDDDDDVTVQGGGEEKSKKSKRNKSKDKSKSNTRSKSKDRSSSSKTKNKTKETNTDIYIPNNGISTQNQISYLPLHESISKQNLSCTRYLLEQMSYTQVFTPFAIMDEYLHGNDEEESRDPMDVKKQNNSLPLWKQQGINTTWKYILSKYGEGKIPFLFSSCQEYPILQHAIGVIPLTHFSFLLNSVESTNVMTKDEEGQSVLLVWIYKAAEDQGVYWDEYYNPMLGMILNKMKEGSKKIGGSDSIDGNSIDCSIDENSCCTSIDGKEEKSQLSDETDAKQTKSKQRNASKTLDTVPTKSIPPQELVDRNGRHFAHIATDMGIPYEGIKLILAENTDALFAYDDENGLLPFSLGSKIFNCGFDGFLGKNTCL